MYSLIFIAKNNIKKHKGEVAILFALIFLAALLLFSSLSLMLSESEIINECDRKYHISDLLVFTIDNGEDELGDIISSIDNTAEYEVIPMLTSATDYYYGDTAAEDAISFTFYFFDSSICPHLNSFPEEFIDLNDDEVVWFTVWTTELGDIELSIVGGSYGEGRARLVYYDKANSDAVNQSAIDDL